jgi:glycosyltransferase involved in cell wall biosynthesis
MHIGFLTPEYVTEKTPDGGLANYLKKTAGALAGRGHNVTIFLLSDSDSVWFDEKVRIVEIARKVRTTKFSRFKIFIDQLRNSRLIAQRVLQLQNEQPLDIIQASNYESPGNALLHNNKIPVVCRASSDTPLWRRAYGRPRTLEDIFIEWLEFRQIKESDASFSPSYFIADILSKKTRRKIPVIRTPLDLSSTNSLEDTFYDLHLSGKKYILFFGTLSKIKGADLFADIIPRVLNNCPELFFVLIGRDDGLPSGQKVMDYIVKRAPLYEQNIIYHPAIRKSQLYSVISHAECVVLPSRVDNYPNACLEAQYFGIPVIGTRNSSLDEMIIDGKTGFLAKNEDVVEISRLISKVLGFSSTDREEMSDTIQNQIHGILEQDRVGQLLKFYEYVIEKHHARKKVHQ